MSLNIAKKLDFLMRLTGTQNNTLGKALSFDASYISRLRLGKRNLPQNRDLIQPLASFFARNIKLPGQQAALAQRICPESPWPQVAGEQVQLLAKWLSEPVSPADEYDLQMLDIDLDLKKQKNAAEGAECATEFFYGNAGKRQGVEKFLSELCESHAPVSLLLHSDENMQWLYEDASFTKRWSQLLTTIIAQRGKIKIVHTIRRNIEEMVEAIKKWVPIYMTGKIETYYCPRIRDNIFRRTLFIAQKQSAFMSQSIMDTKKTMVNILIRDKAAVNALEDEYFDYLALCRPLVKIFGIHNVEDFLHTYFAFAKAEDSLIMLHSIPSRYTMPERVNKNIAERVRHPIFRQETAKLQTHFSSQLAHGCHITEILCLPDAELVTDGSLPIPFRDLLGQPELSYTVEEFRQHIEAIIELLETQPNYHVILPPRPEINPFSSRRYYAGIDLFTGSQDIIMLMVKENTGVLMHNAGKDTIAFFSSESDITTAFWDYLSRITLQENRAEAIARLREYSRFLK